MKIKKFNESAQNWTKDKIHKMYDEYSEFDDLVKEYLFIHYEDKFEDKKDNYYLNEFWLDEDIIDERGILNVNYKHNGYKRTEYVNYEFSDEEFQNLLIFMNDPEAYKTAQKYNL